MTTERTPAYRTIADSIREDILSRRLVPGDRLPVETELADRFGVSRSTVREALRELASQNLVETTRGATGGTFVVLPRPENLARSLAVGIEMLAGSTELHVDEMLEARELLEIPAVRLAASRATATQTTAIEAYFGSRRVQQAAGRDLHANWNFHTLVMQAANNPLLELMAEPIFYVLQTRFAQLGSSSEFRRQVERDHRAIAGAILNHDGEAAAAAMHDHLEYLRPSYKEFDTRLGRT
jgi:GntR family transcriptional regulator, transcriptional repressor for pyruvate dehydrogenase complex